MTTMAPEYSVQPSATAAADTAQLGALLEALERNPSVIGPVVGYDTDTGRIDAIFQIEIHENILDHGETPLTAATADAESIFDKALQAAGLEARTSGVSVVAGSDPDLLP